MWRQGSGHKCHRANGPRKHAHKDAKVGKDLGKASDITATTDTSHAAMALEDKRNTRAGMNQNLRLAQRANQHANAPILLGAAPPRAPPPPPPPAKKDDDVASAKKADRPATPQEDPEDLD